MFDAGYERQKQEVAEMNEKYRSQSGGGKGWYYWMYVIRDGHPVILGFKNSQVEAESYLYQTVPNENGQVICLDTRDLSSAVRKIKSKILDTSHSLDEATIRMVRTQFKSKKEKKPKNDEEGWESSKDKSEWAEYI